jgi:hypothetical protein
MANEFPKSHFTGVDITSVFPREGKPDNANFLKLNVLDGLPFEDNIFDYIHMRYLISAFSENDWKIAIRELVRVTKVGGIIEIVEDEIEPRNDGPISRLLFSARKLILNFFNMCNIPIYNKMIYFFFFLVLTDLKSRNVDVTIYSRMTDLLNNVECLTDIRKEEIKVPFGKWAGNLGALLANNTGTVNTIYLNFEFENFLTD